MSLLLLLGLATPARAGTQKLTLDARGGELVLSFDPAKIAKAELLEAAKLAPEMSPDAVMTSSLEQCRDDAGKSAPCGSAPNTPTTPRFFRAAEVTIAENRELVRAATERKVPAELAPAREWLRRSAAFYAGLEERKLAFYRSWKPADLVVPVEGIDGSKACAAILARIVAAATPQAKHEIVRHDWHNCMNDRHHEAVGPYPAAPWKTFLKARGVRAKHVPQQGD